MYDWVRLCNEVEGWSCYNFPKADRNDPFLGVVEEVGELAHAILKGRQEIRYADDETAARIRDAVGDIVIFLIHWCGRNGVDFNRAVFDTWAQVRQRDWQRFPKNGRDA